MKTPFLLKHVFFHIMTGRYDLVFESVLHGTFHVLAIPSRVLEKTLALCCDDLIYTV